MVVPKLTVNSVDTKGKSSNEIGRLLKADYLLEPSFRIEGPKVFLRTVLINARRDYPARNYELVRNASDMSAGRGRILPGNFDHPPRRHLRGPAAENE